MDNKNVGNYTYQMLLLIITLRLRLKEPEVYFADINEATRARTARKPW
jgi:hypothetical protein